MASVSRTFTVNCPPPPLLAYLADFSNAPEWDPGSVSCEPLTDPPVRVGSRWRNTSRILGRTVELDYELEHLDDTSLVLRGTNEASTNYDRISVQPVDEGHAKVTYRVESTLHNQPKLGDPVAWALFSFLAIGVVRGIKRAGESLARA